MIVGAVAATRLEGNPAAWTPSMRISVIHAREGYGQAGPAPLSRKKLFGSDDTEVMALLLAGGVRSAGGTADGGRMHTQWGVALNIVRSTIVYRGLAALAPRLHPKASGAPMQSSLPSPGRSLA